MVASCRRVVLACLLLLLAGSALAAPLPRLERERCQFRAPRGDKIECYTLVVAENRADPRSEVRLKVAVMKAKRPLATDPVIYLAGGPPPDPPLAVYQSLGLLLAFVAIPRIVAGPALLAIEALTIFLVRQSVARTLLAAAMTMDIIPLCLFALHMARGR